MRNNWKETADRLGIDYSKASIHEAEPLHMFRLQPAIGFTYDIHTDSKKVIKANWQRWVNTGNFSDFALLNPNTGFSYGVSLNPDGSPLPLETGLIDLQIPGTTRACYGNRKLKIPYTDELVIGYEQQVASDWVASIRFIKTWQRHGTGYVDGNSLDIEQWLNTGQMQWNNWEPIESSDRVTGAPVHFYNKINPALPSAGYIINLPSSWGKGNRDAVELRVRKRYASYFSLDAVYRYSRTRGISHQNQEGLFVNPNRHINFDGHRKWLPGHTFKLYGVYSFRHDVYLGVHFLYRTGENYTRTVSSRFVGIRLNQGIEDVLAEPWGSSSLPAVSVLDLRLLKEIRLDKNARKRLQISLDIFNLLNSRTATDVFTGSANPWWRYKALLTRQNPCRIQLGLRLYSD